MSAKLFVGNLSFDTTSDEIRELFSAEIRELFSAEIRELFSAVGPVGSCHVTTDRDTGRSKGFGFAEMNSKAEADAVKEKFDGQDLHGRALKVAEARPRIVS